MNVISASIPPSRPVNFRNVIFLFLPPLDFKPILEISDKDPAKLLVELNLTVSAYGTGHERDDYFPSTCTNSKNIRSYLFVVSMEEVLVLIY